MNRAALLVCFVLIVACFTLPVAVYAIPAATALLAIPEYRAAVGIGYAAFGVLAVVFIALS